jgi:hypothetical protein
MRNGFGRGAKERDQAFPWILFDQSHPSICLYRPMNHWVLVNLFENKIQIFIQSEKPNQKRFFYSFIEKEVPFLIEREDPIRRLDEIGIHHLGKTEKLSTFQGIPE